jgi:RNA polymerase sigma-70 factor (ECF subfamily)
VVKTAPTTESKEIKESDLVARAAGGDKEAYRALVEKYQSRAFSIAYEIVQSRHDAEDIIQESFVKAYLSIGDFRGQSSFYTWFYRIVYNMAIDFKRRTNRRGGEHAEYDDRMSGENGVFAGATTGKTEGPSEAIFRKEQARKIQEALNEISEEHRAVITLREVDGLSYDEIADVVGVSKGTVMSRLHYARKKLQKALVEFAPGGVLPHEDESGDDEGEVGVGEDVKNMAK